MDWDRDTEAITGRNAAPAIQEGSAVMLIQGAVGLLGFYFHVAAHLHGPALRLWDNFLLGAPALAPLLFPNLVLLACVGLWVLGKQRLAKEPDSLVTTDSG